MHGSPDPSVSSGEDGQQRGRHLGGSFLVRGESGTRHDLESGVGEGPDHLARPCDGEESVLLAPHQLHRDPDPPVQLRELAHVPPAGKVFEEWVAIPRRDRRRWRALLGEGVAFVGI